MAVEPCPRISRMLAGRYDVARAASRPASTTGTRLRIDVQPVADLREQRGRQAEGLVAKRELEVELVAVPLRSDHGRHAVSDGEREVDPELEAVILEGLPESDVAAPLARGAGREPRVSDCVEGRALHEEDSAAACADLMERPLLLALDHVCQHDPVECDIRSLG